MTYWQSLSAAHSPIAWWCNIGKVQQQPKPQQQQQQQHGMSPWNKRNKTFFLTTLISERPLSALCQTTKSMTIQQQQQASKSDSNEAASVSSIRRQSVAGSFEMFIFSQTASEKKISGPNVEQKVLNVIPLMMAQNTHTHRMNRHQQPLSKLQEQELEKKKKKQKLRTPNVIGAQAWMSSMAKP